MKRRGASTAPWGSTRRYSCRAITAAAKGARKARCACCGCCACRARCPRPGARRGSKTADAASRHDRQSHPQLPGPTHVVVEQALAVTIEVLQVQVAAHRPDLDV